MTERSVIRLACAVSLLVITPLGFLTKLYAGPGRLWVNNSLGGVLYEVFWILVLLLVAPRARALRWIVAAVFIATCAVEVSQLWHPPALEAVRASFLGRTLIGTTFSWPDFTGYAVGCAAGWLWGRRLVRPAT